MKNRKEQRRLISVNAAALAFLVVVVLAAGIYIGRGMNLLGGGRRPGGRELQEIRQGGYRFLNPLIECENGGLAANREMRPFRHRVKKLAETMVKNGDAGTIAVYFRDLNNGLWFGINENDRFSPAGLLKIPLMISYFRQAESSPLLLKKRLTVAVRDLRSGDETIRPIKTVEPGRTYRVDDLLYRMIAYADDAAFRTLSRSIASADVRRVSADLSADYDPADPGASPSLSAYASFFRVLFNASYLNREMSEKALGYLSNAAFKDGIVSGVPPDVVVAGTFGERTVLPGAGEPSVEQLHEFGIVYYPKRPYLLGVMTRGGDFSRQTAVIRNISRLVYEEVDRQTR